MFAMKYIQYVIHLNIFPFIRATFKVKKLKHMHTHILKYNSSVVILRHKNKNKTHSEEIISIIKEIQEHSNANEPVLKA